jgi:hypothetical protein
MNIWYLDERCINHKIVDRVQLYNFKLSKVWFHLTYYKMKSYELFTKIDLPLKNGLRKTNLAHWAHIDDLQRWQVAGSVLF